MTCTRCMGGFVTLIYDELKCLNCGHRPAPLRPTELKEMRALETVSVSAPTIRICARCPKPAENGLSLCEKHRKLNAQYVQQNRERKHSILTHAVSHVTHTIQGVQSC